MSSFQHVASHSDGEVDQHQQRRCVRPVLFLGPLLLVGSALLAVGLRHAPRIRMFGSLGFEQKRKAGHLDERMEKAAVKGINVILAKVAIPKMNSKTIPETIKRIGDDPMQKVVDNKKMRISNLQGLSAFQITSFKASKINKATGSAGSTGLSGTLTLDMVMKGIIPNGLTAQGSFDIGEKVNFASAIAITDFEMTMPMQATVTENTGASLNPEEVLQSLKHMTIHSVTNGEPKFKMKVNLKCSRRLGNALMHVFGDIAKDAAKDVAKDMAKSPVMQCKAADMAMRAGQGVFNMYMGDKFQTIFQNVFDKQLPMTLGDKARTTGTISGHLELRVSQARRLSPAANFSAEDASEAAVASTIARMANVPQDAVSVQLELDKVTGHVTAKYNISVDQSMHADVYDVEARLENHTSPEMSQQFSDRVARTSGAGYNLTLLREASDVLDPEVHVLGSASSGDSYPLWKVVLGFVAVILASFLAIWGCGFLDGLKKGKNKKRALPNMEPSSNESTSPVVDQGASSGLEKMQPPMVGIQAYPQFAQQLAVQPQMLYPTGVVMPPAHHIRMPMAGQVQYAYLPFPHLTNPAI